MVVSRRVQVAAVAVISRLFIATLQVLFNVLVPDHDADAFVSPGQSDLTAADAIVTFLFGGFTRWDAQYFLHVSQYGYTYENTLAFFPLFPLAINRLGSALDFFFGSVVSFHSSLLVAGVCVNFYAFVLSAVLLYELSRHVLADETKSFASALLFCVNPASIFFSACYSETLFSTLTFGGLLLVEKKWTFSGSALFGLSASVRSNGLSNGGFVIYSYMIEVIRMYSNDRKCHRQFFRKTAAFAVGFCLFLVPFAMFQVYGSLLFCESHARSSNLPDEVLEVAAEKGYRLPSGHPPPWCYQWFPFSYGYVQRTYWNVGFLRYYEFRQIPNFLLATPLMILCTVGCFSYFRTLWLKMKSSPSILSTVTRDRKFVYFVHAAGLLSICTFVIHIQVMTRLFSSSSPVLYWISSSVILSEWTAATGRRRIAKEQSAESFIETFKDCPRSKVIILYFFSFTVLGTLLHVNFFPWT